MHSNVEFKDVAPKGEMRKLTRELIAKLQKKVTACPPDTLFLRVVIEQVAASRWRVTITFELPGKVLAAKEEGNDGHAAIRAAFAEIERQLDAHKSTLRGEQWWKRSSLRKELRQKKAGAAPEKKRSEAFFTMVSPHVDALSQGDLAEGEVSVQDLVDQTLLRAYDEFQDKAPEGDLRGWLNRIAIQEIEAAIRRSRKERRVVYLEEHVRSTPLEEEVSTLGDEIKDFYQPDGVLKVEDVLRDFDLPSPEQETEARELRERIRKALASMPAEWRRLLLFRYVLGLQSADLSRSLRRPRAEIERGLADAHQALRRNFIAQLDGPMLQRGRA